MGAVVTTKAEVEVLAPPAPTRRPTAWGVLAVAGVVVLVGVPVLLALVSAVTHPGLPKGDFALIEMRALDVPADLPLTGVYSRYGFDHPGPILFYLVALPLRLFGPSGLQITAALVNLAAAVGIVVTLYRRGGQLLAVLGVGMVLLLVRALQVEVVSIWNPWVPILPLALAIALTWSVWSRDWWALPWLAGVVTFVVQSHMGFAATGAFLLGSSLVWAAVEVVRGRRATPPRLRGGPLPRATKAVLVAAGVLAVLWLPPLIDQFARDGNLAAILDFARSGQPGESKVGLGAGLEIFSEVVGVDGTLFGGISRFDLWPLQGGPLWSLVLVLVPFGIASGVAIWKHATDAVRLAAIVAVLVLVGWSSVASISGPPYPYIVEWLVAVAAFLWLSTAWSLVTSWWPSAPSFSFLPHGAAPGPSRNHVLLPLGVATLALVVLAGAATAEAVRSPGDGYQGGEVVEAFAGPADDALIGGGRVLLTTPTPDATNAAWALETSAIVSGVQAELERRGFDVVTDDDRAFLVGDDRVVGDGRVDAVLRIEADTSVTPRSDPATTLATFDYLSPDEREGYQALDRKGGTIPPTPLEGAELFRWGDLRARAVEYRLELVDPSDR